MARKISDKNRATRLPRHRDPRKNQAGRSPSRRAEDFFALEKRPAYASLPGSAVRTGFERLFETSGRMVRSAFQAAALAGFMVLLAPNVPSLNSLPPQNVARQAESTSAGVQASSRTQATSISTAQDALALIRDGDVRVDFPLPEGKLGDVFGLENPKANWVTIRPNTTATFLLKVVNGKIDFETSKLQLSSPLDALGPNVQSIGLNAKGQFLIDLRPMFPDVTVGPQLPRELSQFISQLTTLKSLDFRVGWGKLSVGSSISLSKDTSPAAQATKTETVATTAPAASESAYPTSAQAHRAQSMNVPAASAPATRPIFSNERLSNIHIDVKNVTLAPGKMVLSKGNSLELGANNKVSMQGTLSDLTLTGHVNLAQLDISQGKTYLHGAQGTGDLTLHWNSSTPLDSGNVTAEISNLHVQAPSARFETAQGDFVELTNAELKNASLRVDQSVSWNTPGALGAGAALDRLEVPEFSGTIVGAKSTFPDKQGTATFVMTQAQKPAEFKGRVSYSSEGVVMEGEIQELEAEFHDADYRLAGAMLHLGTVKVVGYGKFQFRSGLGTDVEGNFKVDAPLLPSPLHLMGGEGTLSGQVGMEATHVNINSKVGVHVEGIATLDLKVSGLSFQGKFMSLENTVTRLQGTTQLEMSTKGPVFKLNSSQGLVMNAEVPLGQIQIGDSSLTLADGTLFEGKLYRLVAGRNVPTETRLTGVMHANIEDGSLTLPSVGTVKLTSGTRAHVDIQNLNITPQEQNFAGEVMVSAVFDPASMAALVPAVPGLNLEGLSQGQQKVTVTLGGVRIQNGNVSVAAPEVSVRARLGPLSFQRP